MNSSTYSKNDFLLTRRFDHQGQKGDCLVIKRPHHSRDTPTSSVNIDDLPERRHVTCDPHGAHDEIEVVVDAKLRVISLGFQEILCGPYTFANFLVECLARPDIMIHVFKGR